MQWPTAYTDPNTTAWYRQNHRRRQKSPEKPLIASKRTQKIKPSTSKHRGKAYKLPWNSFKASIAIQFSTPSDSPKGNQYLSHKPEHAQNLKNNFAQNNEPGSDFKAKYHAADIGYHRQRFLASQNLETEAHKARQTSASMPIYITKNPIGIINLAQATSLCLIMKIDRGLIFAGSLNQTIHNDPQDLANQKTGKQACLPPEM